VTKESLPSPITQQPSMAKVQANGKINGPSGLRGGGPCFDW